MSLLKLTKSKAPALFALCTLAFFPHLSSAKSFLGIEMERIERVIDFGYNLDPSFENELAQMRQDFPSSPVPEFLEAGSLYWKQYYAENDEDLTERFEKEIDDAIESAKDYLDEHKRNIDAQYVLAACQALQVKHNLDQGQILRAFWRQRKPMKASARILREDPDYHDAKLSIGMANCYLSDAPGFLKTFARLMSFDGDMEKGLTYLTDAKTKGLFSRTDASYYLASVHLNLREDKAAATRELIELSQTYPNNPHFQILTAQMDKDAGNFEAAITRLDDLFDRYSFPQSSIMKTRALSCLYWSLLGTKNFDRALIATNQSIAYFNTEEEFEPWLPWTFIAKADALQGLGRWDEAIATLEKVPSEYSNAYEFAKDRLSKIQNLR